MDLGISLDKLEKQIFNERCRNRRMRKKNEGNNERNMLKIENIEKLKNFYTHIATYPKKEDIKSLSDNLNTSEKKIRNWFARERFRKNKEEKIKTILNVVKIESS